MIDKKLGRDYIKKGQKWRRLNQVFLKIVMMVDMTIIIYFYKIYWLIIEKMLMMRFKIQMTYNIHKLRNQYYLIKFYKLFDYILKF